MRAAWPYTTVSALSATAVSSYLKQRFAGGARLPLGKLAVGLHQRTEGNLLFMANVADAWVAHGLMTQHQGQWEWHGDWQTIEIPATIRQFIAQQLDRVSSVERVVLEVASVAGGEFPTAAVAAALGATLEEVEQCCEGLVQRQRFLQCRGIVTWPDGTVASQYGFVHLLYQEVVYDRVSGARRVALHQRIGSRQEQGYGERASEVAAELAMHFERGQDTGRAVYYCGQAAQNAGRRSAYREALTQVTRGLALTATMADTPARARHELRLQLVLAYLLMATQGSAALEVDHAYSRSYTLARQHGETAELCAALDGLCLSQSIRA